MRDGFESLTAGLFARLTGDEVLLCSFSGEVSDFVRLNGGRVRQAGNVTQSGLELQLIVGQRHASGSMTLTGGPDDAARLASLLDDLRARVPHLPEDPHLLYATDVLNTERVAASRLPDAADGVEAALGLSEGLDLVGIWASGAIHSGFANSLGQRNWFTAHSFHLDWSLYARADKAVKCGYAGSEWDLDTLAAKMATGRQQLAAVSRPARTIDPGSYRVYLAPAAVVEVLELLAWGGFSLKEERIKRSPLIKAAEGKARLSPRFTLSENTADGFAPDVQAQGFVKPATVPLFVGGKYTDALVSPRSAREFDVPTNGASGRESPESLDLAAGGLASDSVLGEIGTGLLVNNLWYLNYSDRPSCRATGMTRFATFWVEGGEIVAPLNVMRFDETVYRMFGDNLVDLGAERELVLDAGTYERRSTSSWRVPGALVEDFTFTL